jgi:uncharacterized protein YgbK (DUF1537 family)
MKTIVLDDDPTGTQSARDVEVVWDADVDRLRTLLDGTDTVFIQTNSRARDEASAVRMLTEIKETARQAAGGSPLRFVLRGDSTLRGHVFAETDVFAGTDGVIVFAPAFPGGGRITVEGVHLVREDDRLIPAAETEYARDPVFPFRSSRLVDYVREKSGRPAEHLPVDLLRSGSAWERLVAAPPGTVLVPDADNDEDICAIARAVRSAEALGVRVVVRCAAPLAAELGGVRSEGLLDTTTAPLPSPLLVVCGSHTEGAKRQLDRLDPAGARIVVNTSVALEDPAAEGHRVAERARAALASGVAIIATERERRAEHGRLEHGAAVAAAVSGAVSHLREGIGTVIVKGGITSAEIARAGLGASGARVLGQLLPGVAVWSILDADGKRHPYVVVPGNVGDEHTLARLVDRVLLESAGAGKERE